MAQVKIVAVRLVGGEGYMFAQIEPTINSLKIEPRTWVNDRGETEQYNRYFWLQAQKPFNPRSILDTNVC